MRRVGCRRVGCRRRRLPALAPRDDRSGIEKRRARTASRVAAVGPHEPPGVTMTGATTQGIQTVLHPVSDVDAAKTVYTALLGLPPQTDSPYYVGFETAGQQIG